MADIQGLYAITDPTLTPGERLLPACEAALRGGARLLQYRDKTASPAEREARARTLLALCEAHDAVFLINDDAALAARVGAHGVHLGQSDGAVSAARALLGERAIIGVTCHNQIMLAETAAQEGASYVAFGRFFPSHTKPGAVQADAGLLRHDLPVPKVAIGGITPDNAATLIRAGASALAVIHGLFARDDINDIEATARQFSRLFEEVHPV